MIYLERNSTKNSLVCIRDICDLGSFEIGFNNKMFVFFSFHRKYYQNFAKSGFLNKCKMITTHVYKLREVFFSQFLFQPTTSISIYGMAIHEQCSLFFHKCEGELDIYVVHYINIIKKLFFYFHIVVSSAK